MKVTVVKLGGSLLDLPDLVERLGEWIGVAARGERVLLVVGGGDAADVVRRFDALHTLGEAAGHEHAVRAMALNAHLLVTVLPRARLVADRDACDTAWALGDQPVVEPTLWLEREEHAEGVILPRRWTFTSDSIAAHLAGRVGARRLVLLKSTTLSELDQSIDAAARLGVVDADFPGVSRLIETVELVNLRQQPVRGCVLRHDA